MSIKKNMLVIFMIVMVVMAGGCASGTDGNDFLGGSNGTTGTMEQGIVGADGTVSLEGIGDETGSSRNVGQSTVDVVETTADTSMSVDEYASTTQVSEEESVEESNAEATTEVSDVLTEISTDASIETTTATETANTEQAQPTEDTQPSTEDSQPTDSEPTASQPTEPEPTKPNTPESIIYDPYQVVNLVIAKCQAGGMITTEDNLANLLEEGKITQEEYDEYYPLDGLEGSYYSVFVETDLNIASDIVGNKLGSVNGIADYIAGMLLLETHPIFNVTYAGIYTHNGVDFYEFRCHR